jgi:hypothetical protein
MSEIRKVLFDGFEGYEIATAAIKMIVISSIGPRIAWFSKQGGENLLYWDKDGMKRGDWKIYGGHRVWITRPLGDESEETYLPDNDACTVTVGTDWINAEAPVSDVNHMARGMEIRVLSESEVSIRSYMRNEGQLLSSGGIWNLTCVNADSGKPIEVPLGAGSDDVAWDVVRVAIPRIFAGNVTHLEDSQVEFAGDTMRFTPRGVVCKRCLQAPQGVLRLLCDGYVYEKRAAYNPYARYPFDGCNIGVFIGKDNVFAEMETFGAEQQILPGGTIDNTEVWSII